MYVRTFGETITRNEMSAIREMTAEQIAKSEGVTVDAVRARWNDLRETMPELFAVSFARNIPLNEAQESALRSAKSAKKKTGTVRRPAGNTMAAQGATASPNEATPPVAEKTPENPKRDFRKIGLVALTVAPFLASVDNMFHVTRELTNPFSAVCLTVLVCVSAVGFTVANSRHKVAIAVTVATVAFEAFCNLTRIYGGLMTGASGNPTKFVGLVTDILGTGTHATAIFLGAVTALLISGVQYAAIFEMNKPAPTSIGA